MEKVRHQQLKIVLACIAVLVTVFSLAMTFMPVTVNAAEVITDTSYKSDFYSILLSPVYQTELQSCVWMNFSFTLKQSNNPNYLTYLEMTFWDNTQSDYFGTSANTSAFTKYSYFTLDGYNIGADDWETGYYPYRIKYPDNFPTLMANSKYIVPSMLTFAIDEPDIDTSYYYMNGNTRVDIPSDNVFAEFRIYIALRDDDRSLITISFPEYFASDLILPNWNGLPVGNAGKIIAQYMLGDNQSFNDGYKDGYKDGYNKANGTINTSSDSYIYGYETGQLQGYSNGYPVL